MTNPEDIREMKLTQDDVQFLECEIARLEKRARTWRTHKILIIVALVLSGGFLLAVNPMIKRFRVTTDQGLSSMFLSGQTITAEEMQTYVNTEIDLLRTECMLNGKSILITIIFAYLFVSTFCNGKKDRQYLFLAKFLKGLLDEQKMASAQQSTPTPS